MLANIAVTAQQIGSPVLGYVIPAVVFLFSFFIAFYLYKHFSKQLEKENEG